MEYAMGVKFNDYVILATDMSESFGILRLSEKSRKIYPLTSNVAMALTGEPGDNDQFSRFVQCNFELEKFRDDGFEVSLTRAFHWITWELAQSIRSRSPYIVNPILAGYDTHEKKINLYWMDYLGTGIEMTYAAHGSGDALAMGFLDRHHKPDAPRDVGIELVKAALDSTQTRIMLSLRKFHMVLIDKEGIHQLPDHVIQPANTETQ